MVLSRRACLALGVASFLLQFACEDTGKKSAQAAQEHVKFLLEAASRDVKEVRQGLPQGAEELARVFEQAHPELPSAEAVRKGLVEARSAVPELRVAKSTFFAATAPDGEVIRSNQEVDELAEKDLFEAYSGLRAAKTKGYVEARGSMPEARGVEGRDDSQWVAAVPIEGKGEVLGVYATGWSWSAYAYRLETSLRSDILANTAEGDKVPLIYVYVVVGQDVYGAPVAPTINADAIEDIEPLEKTKGGKVYSTPLEIDRRSFGLALGRVPELGDDVAIAVLRSET